MHPDRQIGVHRRGRLRPAAGTKGMMSPAGVDRPGPMIGAAAIPATVEVADEGTDGESEAP